MRCIHYILIFCILSVGLFFWFSYEKKFFNPDPELIVGHNLVVGIQGKTVGTSTIDFLKKVKPAGIVLYKYNIGKENQFRELIKKLQEIAHQTIGGDYLIMLDEEPGGASRLGLFKGDINSTTTWEIFYNDAGKLKELGINVVLSPLADYEFGGRSFLHSRLHPFSNTEDMISFNNKFILLLKEKGIDSTLKHFPGLGFIKENTHTGIRRTDVSLLKVMESVDVFRRSLEANPGFLMLNNAIYDSIDPINSASLSGALVDLVRKDLLFDGIIITDDIVNMPIGNPERMSIKDSAVGLLKAGNNIVLLGSRQDTEMEVYLHLLELYNKDISFRDILNKNYLKIIDYKNNNNHKLP